MNIKQFAANIQKQSEKIENIFLSFSDEFPKLLGITKSSSISALLDTLNDLESENKLSTKTEQGCFNNYNEKYSKLLESLNSKLQDLSSINDSINIITNDSEELEIIAINALVISFKSGDKGRAFSSITDNLKRLSGDMIFYSSKLTEAETSLLDGIQDLKKICNDVTTYQNEIASISNEQLHKISTFIRQTSLPLEEISELSQSVYPIIQKAMESLQLQDIIKQAFYHVILCLEKMTDDEAITDDYKKLDSICFNISLAELSKNVLNDIEKNLKIASNGFANNWNNVHAVLDETEEKRKDYLANYFLTKDINSETSIIAQLNKASENYQSLFSAINMFQNSQRYLVNVCHAITNRATRLNEIFSNLNPVITRLKYVRLLQEIEVSKSKEIAAVKNFINDMDILINQASNCLEDIEKIIEQFIVDVEQMLDTFSKTLAEDNKNMAIVRNEKNQFFKKLNSTQDTIYSILNNFIVYPPEFHNQCNNVDRLLERFDALDGDFKISNDSFSREIEYMEQKKKVLMEKLGITTYEQKDEHFLELIRQFTITMYKEVAGELGGFNVEAGQESGEITFF